MEICRADMNFAEGLFVQWLFVDWNLSRRSRFIWPCINKHENNVRFSYGNRIRFLRKQFESRNRNHGRDQKFIKIRRKMKDKALEKIWNLGGKIMEGPRAGPA